MLLPLYAMHKSPLLPVHFLSSHSPLLSCQPLQSVLLVTGWRCLVWCGSPRQLTGVTKWSSWQVLPGSECHPLHTTPHAGLTEHAWNSYIVATITWTSSEPPLSLLSLHTSPLLSIHRCVYAPLQVDNKSHHFVIPQTVEQTTSWRLQVFKVRPVWVLLGVP